MKFSIQGFLSKRNKICSFLRIWLHLLKKVLMKNFIFCAIYTRKSGEIMVFYAMVGLLNKRSKEIISWEELLVRSEISFQTSMKELFTIKSFILDVWQSSKFTPLSNLSEIVTLNNPDIFIIAKAWDKFMTRKLVLIVIFSEDYTPWGPTEFIFPPRGKVKVRFWLHLCPALHKSNEIKCIWKSPRHLF